jgi:type I restriction enzyme S subunit
MSVEQRTIAELVVPCDSWNPSGHEGVFRYIDLSSIDKDTKSIATVAECPCLKAPSRARQIVVEGDVLVATVRPNLNGVALVESQHNGMTASTGYCVLRPRQSVLDSRYLFHWVRTPQFVAAMVRVATGATYPAVSDGKVKASKIPLPPLLEQKRIATILDAIDTLRAKRLASIEELVAFRRASFLEMFGAPQDDRWPISTVGQCGRVQLGRQRAPKYQTGRHSCPYLRVANVYEDRIDLTDVKAMDFDQQDFDAYALQYGDILLNEGQSTELVGRPAMWRSELDRCCFQNTLIRFRADPSQVTAAFALEVFLSYLRSGEFAKISTKTSNVAHLGAARFAAMRMPVPPLPLQERYASLVELFESHKKRLDVQLACVDKLFAALQSQAFAGELATAVTAA